VTYLANGREKKIFESLKKWSTSVEQVGGGRWKLALANGKSFALSAEVEDQWLTLDAPVSDRVTREAMWDLLRLNTTLEGPSKFLLLPDNRSVHLRAELLLEDDQSEDRFDDESDYVSERLHHACTGMKAAFQRFHGKPTYSIEQGVSDESRLEELRRRCDNAGWPFTERSEGKLAVELDTPEGFYQALVEQQDAGARVSIEITRCASLGETSRQALSALLLKCGALVRLARPSIEETDNSVAARFEVSFGGMPTAIEVRSALSSLSVACAICGREARVLGDPSIAKQYLAIGAAPGARHHPNADVAQSRKDESLMGDSVGAKCLAFAKRSIPLLRR
jgi:hypothetical protein